MKQYFLNLLTAVSQFFNTLLGGNPDQTISGMVGYKSYVTKRWSWRSLEWVINGMFWFDPEHCFKSVQWDRVK